MISYRMILCCISIYTFIHWLVYICAYRYTYIPRYHISEELVVHDDIIGRRSVSWMTSHLHRNWPAVLFYYYYYLEERYVLYIVEERISMESFSFSLSPLSLATRGCDWCRLSLDEITFSLWLLLLLRCLGQRQQTCSPSLFSSPGRPCARPGTAQPMHGSMVVVFSFTFPASQTER